MRKLLLIVALGILFSSCMRWHLRRSEHHLLKAIQLGAVVDKDTVWADKEVFVPQFVGDTVMLYANLTDTVTVVQDKVVTKVKYSTKEKTVYVKTLVKADTVYLRIPVTTTKTIKAGYTVFQLILAGIFGAVVGCLLGWLARSRTKETQQQV